MKTATLPVTTHLVPECAARPGDDPIFSLNAQARKRAAAGEPIINATLGALMDDAGKLAVMPAVAEAYARIPAELASAYAPISGPPRFLEAVARELFGADALDGQCVACATPGGTGALYTAIVNFLEPGQQLLTSSFYWGPYQTLAEHTRRGLASFETFDERGGFHVAAFARALEALLAAQGRALVILNTPCHNPTGYSLDAHEWQGLVDAILRLAPRGPITLLVDAAYARFAAPNAVHWQPIAARLAGKAQLLVAWSASKSYAQYGARVGALVALAPDPAERERLRHAFGFSCRGTWSNGNHMGLLAISELLVDAELRARCDAQREGLRALLSSRVEVFNREAARAGLRYPRYEGGFFVTVFSRDAQRAQERLLERGVFVVPVDGALRVALCSTPVKEIPRLCEELGRALGRD